MIPREHADEIELIFQRRGHLELAAQVHLLCRTLALLRDHAKNSRGGVALELLRDPVKMAAALAAEQSEQRLYRKP